jgi:hypothetical protein
MLRDYFLTRLKTSAVWRCGLPVVSVSAAQAATYLLQPHVFRTPHFFLAVIVSSCVWGAGPGLLAAARLRAALHAPTMREVNRRAATSGTFRKRVSGVPCGLRN